MHLMEHYLGVLQIHATQHFCPHSPSIILAIVLSTVIFIPPLFPYPSFPVSQYPCATCIWILAPGAPNI